MWPLEQEDRLRQLVADGLTMRGAAIVLGLTRSTVGGKASRMGLKWKTTPSKLAPKRVRKRRSGRKAATKPRGPTPIVLAGRSSSQPVTILQLEAHHCRWPLDGALYCGAHRNRGEPYCEPHLNNAYRRFERVPDVRRDLSEEDRKNMISRW